MRAGTLLRAVALLGLLGQSAACSTPEGSAQTSSSPDLGGAGADMGVDVGAPDLQQYDADAGAPDAGAADLDWHVEPACPTPTISAPPAHLGLDAHYTRFIDLAGIPLIGSDAVPDDAFRVAYYVIANMLRERPCEHQALVRSGVRIGLIAQSERTTQMPEYRDFYEAFPGTDWDTRGRGFGATLVRPLTTGAEENLLRLPGDGWAGESIMLHEFAHSYFELGVLGLEGGEAMQERLEAAFDAAVEASIWSDTYAETNSAEYWAEGVQSWFDNNLEADPANGIHGPIDTRDELIRFDPSLGSLIAELFDDQKWAPYCDPSGAGPSWDDPLLELPDAGRCELSRDYPTALSCTESTAHQSLDDGRPVTATFVNRTYGDLDLFWLGYDGEEVSIGSLSARSQWSIDTYATHPFVARDADGNCVALHIAADIDESIFAYE